MYISSRDVSATLHATLNGVNDLINVNVLATSMVTTD